MFIHFKPRVVQLLYLSLQPPPRVFIFFKIPSTLNTFFFFTPTCSDLCCCRRPSMWGREEKLHRRFCDSSSTWLSINVRKDAVEDVEWVLPVSLRSQDKPHVGLRLLSRKPPSASRASVTCCGFCKKKKTGKKVFAVCSRFAFVHATKTSYCIDVVSFYFFLVWTGTTCVISARSVQLWRLCNSFFKGSWQKKKR